MRAALALMIVLGACGHAGTPQRTHAPSPTPASRFKVAAESVVSDLAAGHFNVVEAKFDATMKAELSVDKLATDWIGFQAQVGGYRSHGDATETTLGDVTTELVPITTAKGSAQVRVSYHDDGTIAGLFFRSAGVSPSPTG